MSQKFYLTVGQKYKIEPHPQGLHPDGYAVINADNYDEARQKAFNNFGTTWANIYEEDDFKDDFLLYSRGELMNIS